MPKLNRYISDKLPKVFRLAKAVSKYSTHNKYKLGAVLFVNGKPVRFGFNSMKTHRMIGEIQPLKTIHAEVDALSGWKHNWKNSDKFMVVYRQTKKHCLANARPCPICEKILKEYGIQKVYYTTDGGWAFEAFI